MHEGAQARYAQGPIVYNFKVQSYPSCVQSDRRSAIQIRGRPRLRRPAAIDNSEIWRYIAQRDLSGLAQCLENGADANQMCTYIGTVKQGWTFSRATPLITVICQEWEISPFLPLIDVHWKKDDKIAFIKVLLEHGADPTGCDSVRVPAYWYALRTEDPEIIKTMIWALLEAQGQSNKSMTLRPHSMVNVDNPLDPVAWDLVWALITSKGSMVEKLKVGKRAQKSIILAGCLQLAVLFDNSAALNWLLASGVSPHRCYSLHSSAFSIALRQRKTDSVYTIALSSRVELHEDIWYHEVCHFIEQVRFQEARRPTRLLTDGSVACTSSADVIPAIMCKMHLLEGLRHAIKYHLGQWARLIIADLVLQLVTPLTRPMLESEVPFKHNHHLYQDRAKC
jgi:hypothetical protein